MAHFAYQSAEGNNLRQGDLIAKTEAVRGICSAVHPHYLKDDYTHFLVISQSCDLVRRDGTGCVARYVSLAAVRPFDLVLKREIAKHQHSDLETVGCICAKERRPVVERFLERVLNNNEPEYFYLHGDPQLGLPLPSCAFLRLSIAVKAELHYDALLSARVLSLTDAFAAKLGWLIGNVYSRVGTEDWTDYLSGEAFKGWVKDLLDGAVQWHDRKLIQTAAKSLEADTISQGMDAVRARLQATRLPKRKEILLERVQALAEAVHVEPEQANELQKRLRNDPTFAQYAKDR
jgi:hypothetical protein